MKLSFKFTLCATILYLPTSCAIAEQAEKQLHGGRNAMKVTTQELGEPQEEFLIKRDKRDEVLSQDDDDDDDELKAFIDYVNAQDASDSPALEDLDEDELDIAVDDEDDDDELEELQAFIDYVNSKEGLLSSQQNTGTIIVEAEEDDSDENPGRRGLLSEENKGLDAPPSKTRALGYHGKRCYWYHGYKRCYYHYNHYKPSYYYH